MADFLDGVATYLDTQGVGTFTNSSGRNIFRNHQPGDPDNCVALFGLTGAVIGEQRQVSSLNFPRFQVVVRNTDYDLASAKMAAVRTALHNKYGLSFSGWRVMRLHAQNEGGPIGTDDQGRHEFSITFHVEANAE